MNDTGIILDILAAWWPNLLDVLQILLLTAGVYAVLRFLRGTRAAQMLLGVGAMGLGIFLITSLLDLDVVSVVLRWVSLFMLLALLVVFHPEIRRALSLLGRSAYIQLLQGRIPDTPVDRLVHASRKLADRRLGALIAVERSVSLDRWCETGIPLDALISEELLLSIFTPPLPLHDGGIILRDRRIRAAHCIFPIDNELGIHGVGTRHRAAISLSSECDALVIVISEERGKISVAREGKLIRDVSDRDLGRLLRAAFVPPDEQHSFFRAVFGPRFRIPWFLKPFVGKSPELARKESGNE